MMSARTSLAKKLAELKALTQEVNRQLVLI